MDPEALLDLGYRVKSGKTQVLDPRLIQSSRWRQCQAAMLGEQYVEDLGLACKLPPVSLECGVEPSITVTCAQDCGPRGACLRDPSPAQFGCALHLVYKALQPQQEQM